MAATGPSKTSRKQQPEIYVKEEFKIAVKIAVDRFRFDEKQKGTTLLFVSLQSVVNAFCTPI